MHSVPRSRRPRPAVSSGPSTATAVEKTHGSHGKELPDNLLETIIVACFVSLLAVAVRLSVSGVWYMVENWVFVDSTLFFVAWEKDMLAFRVVRTWFSALTVLENVLGFGLVNAVKRWKDVPDFKDVTKVLPAWSVPILMPIALLK